MFGKMNAMPVADLRHLPEEVGRSLNGAVGKLLDLAGHPAISKWLQLPKALLLFLVVPGDAESGAFYVYDRGSRVWFWVDFDDDKFGGYTATDFDRLIRECGFLDLVERPYLFAEKRQWIVEPGLRPRSSRAIASAETKGPA